MTTFLSCTVIGMIPQGVTAVSKITPGKELFMLHSIRRLQPLVKGDDDSACVITLIHDENLPSGRVVLRETYGEVMKKLAPVIL